ncbi:TPA: hypothetical protein U1333_002109 [Streptococcus suis]|nr:hypothetical protein [Streptococcus suis]HEM5282689.1 hypothetical protein [Streptococcus suis]
MADVVPLTIKVTFLLPSVEFLVKVKPCKLLVPDVVVLIPVPASDILANCKLWVICVSLKT